jgi:aerobic-type carbon monoxide dehydrogenase small subunit (CoxS/CutS family)
MTAATTAAHVPATAVLRKRHGGRKHNYGCGQGSDENLCGGQTVWIREVHFRTSLTPAEAIAAFQ